MGYLLQWEFDGIVKKYFGQLTSAEVVESVLLTESDARFDRLRYVINDYLDVQGMSCTQDDIDVIAAHDIGAASTNPNIKIAMVTRQSEVIDVVRRYLHASSEVFPTKVFPTITEARAWIKVSSSERHRTGG